MEIQNSLVIDVKNLCKSFDGKPAVKDVSLQVKKGEIFGFLGPNGSGKTTTIRMICGLLTPDSGSGQCLGYDILTESDKIKRQVGYMTQSFSLYTDLTIEENLNFVATIYEMPDRQQRVEETIQNLGLTDRKNQLVSTLSGGWKQRLALAAALLHDPKLLLLDEPTAGVDPKARREFWDQIHLLAHKGITTLVSTHYMDEAARCNRLAYISHGHLLIQGTSEEIVEKIGLITWKVSGEDLASLAEQLKKLSGVEQVVSFGTNLHVSGMNEELLNQSLEPYRANYRWTKIHSNLEDVFIHLVGAKPE